MNDVAVQDKGKMLEQVLIKGDLSGLTNEQRSSYYIKVCESVGLNMLTKPFEFINLNGKLVLYALRACTDQLRTIHGVSVLEMTETEREGVFIVTAKVSNKDGRTDMAKGAVNISGLKGEALANALMKAETKAKRRATLSICGLGMLDETEIETIPGAAPMQNITPSDVDKSKPESPFKNANLRNAYCKGLLESFMFANSHDELEDVMNLNKAKLDAMLASGAEADTLGLESLRNSYQVAWNRIARADKEDEAPIDEVTDGGRVGLQY